MITVRWKYLLKSRTKHAVAEKGNIMNDLQDRVQKILKVEAKRRDIALKWVCEIKDILLPISEDIWGTGENFGGIPSSTITLTEFNKDKKEEDTSIYFRYNNYDIIETEYVGFYDNSFTNCNLWGKSLEDLRGKDFWYAIKVILGWIPQVIEAMDKREERRNALLAKIK